MTNEQRQPIPDPARTVAEHRPFGEVEKRQIIDEALRPGVSVVQVGRQ